MDPMRASITALGAAYRRAYHDAYDTPKVFEDRFAALFVSPDEATAIEDGFIHILTQARPHLAMAGDRAASSPMPFAPTLARRSSWAAHATTKISWRRPSAMG